MSLKKCMTLLVALILIFSVLPSAAASETPTCEEVKAMLEQLPSVEELQAMSQEEQNRVYDQVQAAYDGYQALSPEDRASLAGAEETFQALFVYFNSLVMPLEGTAPQEETAPQETPANEDEGMPWGLTALILAVVVTILQNIFINGRGPRRK